VTVSAYRTQPFSTTHENRAFDELYDELLRVWGDTEEPVVLLGNFLCQGSEIDIAVIKRDSISVVDVKNYGGRIVFSENGPWYADDAPVKGGNKQNPFIQLRDNKYALLDVLNGISEWPSKRQPKLGHISAIVLFQEPIEFDPLQLPGSLKPWFHVVDMDHIAQTLRQITSSSINLTDQDVRHLVDYLGVPEYKRPGTRPVQTKAPGSSDHEITDDIEASLQDVDRFVQSERRILVVAGGVGSGRRDLEAAVRCREGEFARPIITLAPNLRLAKSVEAYPGSVYRHIYARNPTIEDETVLVYPPGVNHDPADCIYLVTHAHLVSDSMFETDLFRYGSGHLLSDFLEWAGLEQYNRKVIFSGDPYQLTRGDAQKTALATSHLASCAGHELQYLPLDLPDPEEADDVLRRNSLRLAWALHQDVYSCLRLECDDDRCVSLPSDQKDRAGKVADIIGRAPYDTKFIGFSNEQVGRVNQWLRSHVFERSGVLARGDLVHIHNSPVIADQEPIDQGVRVEANSWAEVLSVEADVKPVIQPLRGREHSVRIDFLKAELRPLHETQSYWVYVNKDYLTSEKPELPVDSVLALRVHAEQTIKHRSVGRESGSGEPGEKNGGDGSRSGRDRNRSAEIATGLQVDPLLNAAHLRIGYGLTLHKAQGIMVPEVVADANTGQGQANAAYFRWLYTLLQTAEERLWIGNAPEWSPLSGAQWDVSKARLDTVRAKNLVPYNHSGQESDARSMLAALRAQAHENLVRAGMSLDGQAEKPYQLLWDVSDTSGGYCKLRAHYDKKIRVTRIEIAGENRDSTASEAIEALSVGHEPEDPMRRAIYDDIKTRLESVNATVIAIVGDSYKDIYYVAAPTGKVEIVCYYNATGFVTRGEVVRYDDAAMVETVHAALVEADVC